MRPLLLPRTIVFAVPGILLLISLVGTRMPRGRIVWLGSLVSASIAGTLGMGLIAPQEDWRGAASAVRDAARRGDVVLMCDWSRWASLRYHTGPLDGIPVIVASADGDLIAVDGAATGLAAWRAADRAPKVTRLGTVRIPAGSAAFRVERECSPAGEAAVSRVSASTAGEEFWQESGRDVRYGLISVTRRVFAEPVDVPVREPLDP
jgi:hypothetical protein